MTALDKTGASLEAIQYHYDLSNQFYSLWLDENMVYSGARYQSDSDSLETAQINKLDHHLKSAQCANKNRLLEIGCGWGAILKRATQQYGVKEAVGLTLSDAQVQYIDKLDLKSVTAKVENWQDHYPAEPYDAIISIGAFEHFAKLEYTEQEKVDAYRTFFKRCQEDFLKPGSLMSLQTFAYGSARRRDQATNMSATQFLAEQIFPETDPPRLANIAEAIQGHFEIVNLENDRIGYAKTLREWMNRLKNNRAQAIETVGLQEVEKYEQYLQYSFAGFQTANLDLYRITLKRLEMPWKRPAK